MQTFNQNSMDVSLSQNVYSAEQVRQLEGQAAKESGDSLYQLMERAGRSAFTLAQTLWPQSTRWLILAGTGNNGGDAYVTATCALHAGIDVELCALAPAQIPKGDAANARQAWLDAGGSIQGIDPLRIQRAEVIVDGLLGTGARSPLSDDLQTLIAQINSCPANILSLDIPTGLDAHNGQPQPVAIRADHVVTFIAVKPGLLIAQARDYVPHITLDSLGVQEAFAHLATPIAQWRNFHSLPPLGPRKASAHKGHHGRLLCIGGDIHMGGAIRLCAEAALHTGAGLVKIMCHPTLATSINQTRPECMVANSERADEAFSWADVIVAGPGLGTSSWGRTVFAQLHHYLKHHPKPVVLDADALNLFAEQDAQTRQSDLEQLMPILTPHPKEAARLLGSDVVHVESNRWRALQQLQQEYSPYTLLKGPGSLIGQGQGEGCSIPVVCANGNPGMASGGMGDVLSGIIGALLAQGFDKSHSLLHGVLLHSAAADLCAQNQGQRGMLASDLFPFIRQLVNK